MALDIPRATNTRALVCELTDNNDGRTRRFEATRLLRNALMDRCNRPKRTRWISQTNRCLFGSLIHPREPWTNQEGAIVRHLTSKSIWALGHELMIWARGPTSIPLSIPPQAHNNKDSKLDICRTLEKLTAGAPLTYYSENHPRAIYTCPDISPFECSAKP